MTKEDRNRADARFNKAARTAGDARTGMAERDAALKAVTDNMAKLKALRLAREAAEPPRPAAVAKKVARQAEEISRQGPGAVRLAGGTAKRRASDLELVARSCFRD